MRAIGSGISLLAPRTLFQIISFKASIGATSYSSRFIAIDSFAPHASAVFFASKSIRAFSCENGVKSAFVPIAAYIGVAAASYWLIGGNPSNSSIVRNSDDVVYSVLSTVFRFV